MLNYINEKYKTVNGAIPGPDGRYHTVYIIIFESGHFYIGKHTSNNLDKDAYFASGVLPNMLKKRNIEWVRHVIHYAQSSQDALLYETELLSDVNLYNSSECLNCYQGSPPDSAGCVVLHKDNKIKRVNPKLVPHYEESGWVVGGIKRVAVCKDGLVKFVVVEEVSQYLDDGWVMGNTKSRGRVFVVKNNILKYVPKANLQEHISKGWIKQHNISNRKVLRKGGRVIKVGLEDVDSYIAEGFEPSSTIEGLVYIRKGSDYKRVKEDSLSQYLAEGWLRGNNTSAKIYITNGDKEIRIFPEELPLYPSFEVGRIKKVYLNNGSKERRVMVNDDKTIQKYIEDGYIIGKLKRSPLIRVYKNKQFRNIKETELQTYEEQGWTTEYNSDIHPSPRSQSSQDVRSM